MSKIILLIITLGSYFKCYTHVSSLIKDLDMIKKNTISDLICIKEYEGKFYCDFTYFETYIIVLRQSLIKL